MKVKTWLSTCTSTMDYATLSPSSSTTTKPPSKFSDDSMSTSTTSPSSSSTKSYGSLQSNLSLQTLPSVPSLQKLSPETLNISVAKNSVTSLKPHPFHVSFLSVHNNLLYATSGSFINVFDIETFTLIDTFYVKNSSSGSVKSVTFCNKAIFTASQDSKIRAWDLETISNNNRHKLKATLPTVKDRLRRFILPKNYVRVRRHKKQLWIQHHDAVSGLAIFDELLYSVSWDKYLKIWSTSDFRCKESIKAHDDAINAVIVSVDGTIYTASADRSIKVWEKSVKDGRKSVHGSIATLVKHKSAVNALALSRDGSVLFSGSCDRSILVWEREDSANYMVVTGALRGHGKAILCLINVNDLLFSGSADRTVRIWQRGGAERKFCCLTVLDGHAKPVRSLAAAVDENVTAGGGVKVFSGSFDGEIKVWDVVVKVSSLQI
ncbi:protein JINGUBANG [Apium graveolens]|uniref:protein JINGUBANG n=1 Tax=Apium graveolens TaxID=4045 RepID=UPI003D78EDB5